MLPGLQRGDVQPQAPRYLREALTAALHQRHRFRLPLKLARITPASLFLHEHPSFRSTWRWLGGSLGGRVEDWRGSPEVWPSCCSPFPLGVIPTLPIAASRTRDRAEQADPAGLGELLCGRALKSMPLVCEGLGREEGAATFDAGPEGEGLGLEEVE